MLEISIKIFCKVEINDAIAGLVRDAGGRFTSPIAMDKESLSFFAVSSQHTVDMALGAAKGEGSPVLIPIRVICQRFDHFVFFLFIHCKYYLSDNDFLQSKIDRGYFTTSGTFSYVVY